MRVDDSDGDLAAEVAGTSKGDIIEATAWRGDDYPVGLDVEQWSLSWDATRQIQGQGSLTVADPDGALWALSMGDLLAPGGSRVSLAWVSGTSGLRVPLGVWRIRRSDPDVTFRVMRGGTTRLTVPSGGRVVLSIDEDAMATAVLCRMDAESPTAGTRIGEVRRLLSAIDIALEVDEAVTDKAVPSSLVYEDERMDAIEDHLSNLGAVYRGGAEGSLEVLPASGREAVWTIDGGDGGALMRVAHSLSDETIYNAAVSRGETTGGAQLVGRAHLEAGALAWGGPFGQVPIFHQSPATTQAGVSADARTLLDNRISTAEVTIEVSCLFHPGLQPHDVVTVLAPTTAGAQPITGRVVSMSVRSISGSGSTPTKSMDLGVAVNVEALEALAARVRRAGG